ncbi:hypothetical protein D3C73_1469590 [compost metagenome]
MSGRQYEPVAVDPFRVAWVMLHKPGPQLIGHWSRAHWHAGMAGIRFVDSVDSQRADGIDRFLLNGCVKQCHCISIPP